MVEEQFKPRNGGTIQTSRYAYNQEAKKHLKMVQELYKSHIWLHNVKELVMMIEIDSWFTKRGVQMQKINYLEDHYSD